MEKPATSFSQNGWFQADTIFKADRFITLTPDSPHQPPAIVECHHWLAGCAKREENDINIAEPCIHKAGVSRIDKMIFSSFNQRYLLFIIFINQGSTNNVHIVYHRYGNLFLCMPKISKAYAFINVLCQLSAFGFPFFFTTHHNILFWRMFFTIEIEKFPYSTLH